MKSLWTSPHQRSLPDYHQRVLVMGILNVTPDSFSDGGRFQALEQAREQAARMVAEGADILDVGGESTRPGSHPVDSAEELRRVIPVIRALREDFPGVPLSIDTFKAEVAREAIAAGADIINDVQGLRHDLNQDQGIPFSPMAHLAAALHTPVVIMHNRPQPAVDDFWDSFQQDILSGLQLARQAGIADHQIWLDPGFGFGKTVAQNLEVLRRIDRLVDLGYPVVLGTSRKSTIGKVLDREVHERLEGTIATNLWGLARGCRMVRIHDVGAFQLHRQMVDAISRGLDYSKE